MCETKTNQFSALRFAYPHSMNQKFEFFPIAHFSAEVIDGVQVFDFRDFAYTSQTAAALSSDINFCKFMFSIISDSHFCTRLRPINLRTVQFDLFARRKSMFSLEGRLGGEESTFEIIAQIISMPFTRLEEIRLRRHIQMLS